MFAQQIAARIRIARLDAGLTQQELGERAGIHPMMVSRYESDKAVPNVQNLLALADALGVSVDYLLGRVDERTAILEESDLPERDRRVLALLRRRGDIAALVNAIVEVENKRHGGNSPQSDFGPGTGSGGEAVEPGEE